MRLFHFALLPIFAIAALLSASSPANAYPWGYHGYRPYYGGYYSGFYPGYGFGYGHHHWGGNYPSYGYRSSYPGYGGYSYYPSYGYSSYYPGYGNYPPRYTYPSYPAPIAYSNPTPTIVNPGIVRSGATTNSTSMYYAPPATDNTARLRVLVPADAQVWVDGYATTKTGATREFTSPALDPARNYTYEIKARWMKEGAPVEQTRRVNVQANKTTTVDFGIVPERDK